LGILTNEVIMDISFKRILYTVNIQRDLWINNEYNKPGRQIDPILIQSLGCVEVITVDEGWHIIWY
jgi:hypothetical protein